MANTSNLIHVVCIDTYMCSCMYSVMLMFCNDPSFLGNTTAPPTDGPLIGGVIGGLVGALMLLLLLICLIVCCVRCCACCCVRTKEQEAGKNAKRTITTFMKMYTLYSI